MPSTADTTITNRIMAYWYACGHNDHRTVGQQYVDPNDFADHWNRIMAQPSRPSLQDTFKAFATQQIPALVAAS